MNKKTTFNEVFEKQMRNDRKAQVLKICREIVLLSENLQKLYQEIAENPLIAQQEKGRFLYLEKKLKDLSREIIINGDKFLMQ
jgi:hypothetical protein